MNLNFVFLRSNSNARSSFAKTLDEMMVDCLLADSNIDFMVWNVRPKLAAKLIYEFYGCTDAMSEVSFTIVDYLTTENETDCLMQFTEVVDE